MSRGYCGGCGEWFDEVTPCKCGKFSIRDSATKADTDKLRHLSDIPAWDYASLLGVLMDALYQASNGKGRERHSDGEPFEQQICCQITRRHGLAFATGQAAKKLDEVHRLLRDKGPNAAIAECLGAINYAAAAVIVLQEEMERTLVKPGPVSE